MSLGLEMAVPILLFGFLGNRLDVRMGTEPWWMVGGGLLGIAVGFYSFYKRVLGIGSNRSETPDSEPTGGTEPDESSDESP